MPDNEGNPSNLEDLLAKVAALVERFTDEIVLPAPPKWAFSPGWGWSMLLPIPLHPNEALQCTLGIFLGRHGMDLQFKDPYGSVLWQQHVDDSLNFASSGVGVHGPRDEAANAR